MFAHVPIALILQAIGYVIARVLGAPVRSAIWSGAFAAIAACVMREITQAEYRYIEGHGGLRRFMPDLEGLKVWTWNAHSISETVVATAVVALVAALVSWRVSRRRDR